MGIHARYKADTKTYTNWLEQTATENDYNTPMTYNLEGNLDSQTITAIAVWLGALGGRTGLTLTLPAHVWRAFRRTVNLRQSYLAWYSKEHPEDALSNARHGHFINVLVQSVTHFWNFVHVQKVASRYTDQNDSSTTPMTLQNAYNSFIQQGADESDSEDEFSGEDVPQCVPSTLLVATSQPLVISDEELSFQKFCFMKDVVDYLICVDKAWEDYFAGRIDLYTATMKTNVVVEYVGKQEEDMEQNGVTSDLADLIHNYCTDLRLHRMVESVLDIHELGSKVYPLALQRLSQRKTSDTGDSKIPQVDGEWEAEERILVEVLNELFLECRIRHDIWENGIPAPRGHQRPISRASLDQASRVLKLLLDGEKPKVVTVFAAEVILSSLPMDKNQYGKPLTELLETAMAIGENISKATQAGVEFPLQRQNAMNRCLTLLDYINHSPLTEHKYVHIRSLPSEHPLSGMHQTIEQDIELSPINKAAFLDSVRYMANHSVDQQALSQFGSQYYSPSWEPNSLREVHSACTGTLLVDLLIQYEGAGLDLANASGPIFAMCHLYNALGQTGQLLDNAGNILEWPLLDLIIERHKKSLFMGKLPDEPEKMMDRMLMSAGASGEMIRKANKLRAKGYDPAEFNIFKMTGKRSWDLFPSPLSKILRNYIEGENVTLLQTIYKIYDQMRDESGPTQSNRKILLEKYGLIPFLEDLQIDLANLFQEQKTDYIALTRICNELFQKMDMSILASLSLPNNNPEDRGVGIAMSILAEIGTVFNNRAQPAEATRTNLVRIARVVLQVYLRKERQNLET